MGTLSSIRDIIEESLTDSTKLLNSLPAEKYKEVMTFLPSLRPFNCNCGQCIDVDKLSDPIPPELECLTEISYQG